MISRDELVYILQTAGELEGRADDVADKIFEKFNPGMGNFALTDSGQTYTTYQIAASEALRAGCDTSCPDEKRISYFREAAHWAKKAVMIADRTNVCEQFLAICQYQCAVGEILLVEAQKDELHVLELKDKA